MHHRKKTRETNNINTTEAHDSPVTSPSFSPSVYRGRMHSPFKPGTASSSEFEVRPGLDYRPSTVKLMVVHDSTTPPSVFKKQPWRHGKEYAVPRTYTDVIVEMNRPVADFGFDPDNDDDGELVSPPPVAASPDPPARKPGHRRKALLGHHHGTDSLVEYPDSSTAVHNNANRRPSTVMSGATEHSSVISRDKFSRFPSVGSHQSGLMTASTYAEGKDSCLLAEHLPSSDSGFTFSKKSGPTLADMDDGPLIGEMDPDDINAWLTKTLKRYCQRFPDQHPMSIAFMNGTGDIYAAAFTEIDRQFAEMIKEAEEPNHRRAKSRLTALRRCWDNHISCYKNLLELVGSATASADSEMKRLDKEKQYANHLAFVAKANEQRVLLEMDELKRAMQQQDDYMAAEREELQAAMSDLVGQVGRANHLANDLAKQLATEKAVSAEKDKELKSSRNIGLGALRNLVTNLANSSSDASAAASATALANVPASMRRKPRTLVSGEIGSGSAEGPGTFSSHSSRPTSSALASLSRPASSSSQPYPNVIDRPLSSSQANQAFHDHAQLSSFDPRPSSSSSQTTKHDPRPGSSNSQASHNAAAHRGGDTSGAARPGSSALSSRAIPNGDRPSSSIALEGRGLGDRPPSSSSLSRPDSSHGLPPFPEQPVPDEFPGSIEDAVARHKEAALSAASARREWGVAHETSMIEEADELQADADSLLASLVAALKQQIADEAALRVQAEQKIQTLQQRLVVSQSTAESLQQQVNGLQKDLESQAEVVIPEIEATGSGASDAQVKELHMAIDTLKRNNATQEKALKDRSERILKQKFIISELQDQLQEMFDKDKLREAAMAEFSRSMEELKADLENAREMLALKAQQMQELTTMMKKAGESALNNEQLERFQQMQEEQAKREKDLREAMAMLEQSRQEQDRIARELAQAETKLDDVESEIATRERLAAEAADAAAQVREAMLKRMDELYRLIAKLKERHHTQEGHIIETKSLLTELPKEKKPKGASTKNKHEKLVDDQMADQSRLQTDLELLEAMMYKQALAIGMDEDELARMKEVSVEARERAKGKGKSKLKVHREAQTDGEFELISKADLDKLKKGKTVDDKDSTSGQGLSKKDTTMRKPATLGTSGAKFVPLGEGQLLKLITKVIDDKIVADEIDDNINNPRQLWEEFCVDFLLNKYGMMSLAEKHMGKLKQSVILYNGNNVRLKEFGRLLGWTEPAYDLKCQDVWCDCLKALCPSKGKGYTDDKQGHTYYCQSYVLQWLATRIDAEGLEEIKSEAMQAVSEVPPLVDKQAKSNEQVKVDIDLALAAFMASWAKYTALLEERKAAAELIDDAPDSVILRAKFKEFDEDGDGVLSMEEFKPLVLSLAPESTSRQISKVFRECLVESNTGSDKMTFIGFRTVMRRSGLMDDSILAATAQSEGASGGGG